MNKSVQANKVWVGYDQRRVGFDNARFVVDEDSGWLKVFRGELLLAVFAPTTWDNVNIRPQPEEECR